MASSTSRKTISNLVYAGTLELKRKACSVPVYNGVVVAEDILLVTDVNEWNLQIYSLRDSRLLSSHELESRPYGVCLISKTEVAVCLSRSIVIVSFKSIDDVKRIKTLDLRTGFNCCDSVAKLNSYKLLVSGVNNDAIMLCWGVVSITDGRLDSTHNISKGKYTHMAIKDNTVYISCRTYSSITTGVYAYDILNPHAHKFLYQHKELKRPWSIMADRNSVFVCDLDSNRIHQLTDSGQLVTIHTLSSRLVTIHTLSSSPYGIFYDDQHGVLYITSIDSSVITLYKMEYLHQAVLPVEILNMDDRSIQLFEDALKDGREIIYSLRIMVVGHMGVGKTTLVKRLLGEEVNISERHSTEGIDVYVNCCDVSLSTCEWTRREKDSKQDYKLQRLVKVLNENYQMSGTIADQEQVANSPQKERADHIPVGIAADDDEDTLVIYHRSPQKNIGQNLSSTASLQEESPSTIDQSNHTQVENNMMAEREPGESNATENHKTDPLRDMLKLLKENPDKAKQDVRKYAHLTIWDFAGQYAFYTTHQMFLTRRAIYLLVSDVSGQITDVVEDECYFDSKGKMKCKVHELVEIWMNYIHSCAPPDNENVNSAISYTVIPPPVILVGTHVDKIGQRQLAIRASEDYKQPQILSAAMTTANNTSKPIHFGEQSTLSICQESLQPSSERLQRKRKATDQVFSSSIQKGVACADPKLLYQVLYNSTQGAHSSRSTLERNCQTLGLQCHEETPGNGNCFFEAVFSQLQRLNCQSQISPQQLRQGAVAFLKVNRVLQVPDGTINFAEFMCNENFEEYCARMAKDGEWADHILVVAMARTLQRDIMVVTSSPSSGSDDIIAWVVGQDHFQGDPILLGHIWEHHYESLEPIDSSDLMVKGHRQNVEKIEFDENDTKNQMNVFGNYGDYTVMPSAPVDYNPGARNPMQHDVQMNQLSMFGGNSGDIVMPVFSGNNNSGQINPFHCNPQDLMNQLSMFGGNSGDIVMPVFSGNNNSGQINPFHCNPQDLMNQMGMFVNYGGNNAMPVVFGDDIPNVRNPVQCDPQVQMMNMVGDYGGHIWMPVNNIPWLINPIQYDQQSQMNQMAMFRNIGDQTGMTSFPVDNRPGLINSIQHIDQAQMNLMSFPGDIIPGRGNNMQFYAEHSLDAEHSTEDYLDSENRMELGLKYLTEIRSYLRDKPTIVHLVDKDFAIDNTVVDGNLDELKRKIFEVASRQPYWGEEIPTRWFLLEQQLMKLRDAGMKVISHSTVEDLNKKATIQIKESEELDLFLKYLHETGTIIYFSIEVLRDNIVLDPKWLIDALKLLINAHPNLPENLADNESQSNTPADNDADNGSQSNSSADSNDDTDHQSNSPVDSNDGNGSQSNGLADSAVSQKWSDFKEKGILSSDLVDAIWTRDKHPELHAHKDHILMIMEQFNIIAKPRSFSEIGEKVENYFLVPCMLRQESPREVISLEQDPHMVGTPVLCCVFRGKYLPPPIFHRLVAACITRWPVAKKKVTSENLIFCGSCVFDIDLFHRLSLHFRNHIIFARITRMIIDEVKTLDARLCTRVRKFITLNLSKITSYLGQNLQYELRTQCPPSQCVSEDGMAYLSPPFDMWFADEGHDPDIPITPEHMNHARLCVALVTVCGNAMREVLRTHVPTGHTNIYQTIHANKGKLTGMQGRPLLNPAQIQLVYPDPHGQKTGTLDQFDLSLLYTLIRNISTVPAPITGWGKDPQDQPRDTTLGASVERVRSYRNHISGHSPDGKVSQQDLQDYWNKFEAVLHDIETIIGGQVYSQDLEQQKRQVISIYEAC